MRIEPKEPTMKWLLGIILLLGFTFWRIPQAGAQENLDSLINNDLPFFEDLLKDQMANRIAADTLYARIVPSVDMETIEDRASCLNLDMPLVINKTVCGFIHFFTVRKRNYTQTMLERKNYYFPIFEYYLRKHEMPDALKYLAIVESGLNYKASSKAGAVGLWQFMPGTGRDFYLSQNQHIDERQNPYLATEAACKFLKYLHGMFNDWELALAAYNCGPGNVLKAMRRSGKRGFWEIYNFLPQETRSYVPQFHAVVYSMNFAKEHNIHPDLDSVLVTTPLDTFEITRSFDMVKLESILGLPAKCLHHCNPAIKSNVFPAGTNYRLLVPSSHSQVLSMNLQQYLDSAHVTASASGKSQRNNPAFRYVRCRKGEQISHLAEKHGVDRATLCKLNHLHGNKVTRTGKLKVPVAATEASTVAKLQVPVSNPSPDVNKSSRNEGTPGIHVVKKGEKLFQIAIQNDLTLKQIKQLNRLTSSKLEVGQELIVRETTQSQNLVQPEPDSKDKATSEVAADVSHDRSSYYIVRKGDRLLKIADRLGVTVQSIQEWNPGLSQSLLAGQKLRIAPIENETVVSSTDSVKIHPAHVERTPEKSRYATKEKKKPEEVARKTYLVQKGDTLYSITRKFSSLTIKDLMRINKLKDKKIKPGQQLIIG